MASRKALAPCKRCHVVLVPGFGGFDALGKVEYYAGITRLFQRWRDHNAAPLVLHYFDNFPTAAVVTRAARLRSYLAKRIARGEILETDAIVLVGHSTAGLDIRRLICDLGQHDNRPVHVDGGYPVPSATIRDCLRGVVFLSVPHWGTNIADWVCSHPLLRTAVLAEVRAAVAGSQVYLLDWIESRAAGGAAFFTDAELLLAAEDALTEANQNYGHQGPQRTAEAQEAASELELYVRHMRSDFSVINDLTSQSHDHPGRRSPAHFNDDERRQELELWDDPPIRCLSYLTVAGRPFRFASGRPAPVWELTNPCTYPEIVRDLKLSEHTDFLYRMCYRACAGGPLRRPAAEVKLGRVLGSPAPEPIELWDNDGIVNTVSMFWPLGKTVLVMADHLDIIGHYKLVKVPDQGGGRKYQSYDSFRSVPRFTDEAFEEVWTGIFAFSAGQAKPAMAAAAGRA